MKFKEELRLTGISLLVSLLLTVFPAIFLTIIGQPLIYAILVFIVTLLVRRKVIRLELKLEYHNGDKKGMVSQ